MKYPPFPGHILERQIVQRRGPVSCWPSLYVHSAQARRPRWLGHIHCTNDDRIQKDNLYGEMASGKRTTGRSRLRYKDVCMGDMKAPDIDAASWEGLAADRTIRRSTLNQHLKTWEEKLMNAAERTAATTANQRLHTDATLMVESASPASVLSPTSDAAQAEQIVRSARMLHPWSAMTEVAHYYLIISNPLFLRYVIIV